jgi:hypothetical protein
VWNGKTPAGSVNLNRALRASGEAMTERASSFLWAALFCAAVWLLIVVILYRAFSL